VPRAFRSAALSELAARLPRPLAIDGNTDPLIEGVASLERAGPGDLAFVRTDRFSSAARASRAAAFVAAPGVVIDSRPVLRSPRPDLDFARLVGALMGDAERRSFAPDAPSVAPGAQIDPSARLGPGCLVGERARVGARSVLQAGVVLYPDVDVGEDCELHAGVIVREGTRIGDRVVLHPGVVLGSDGFGYIADEQGQLFKVPQVGIVVIEDDVEIGANTTVDRATLDETRIRRGARIDNLVQIAHNCDVGEGAVIAAQVGLSGSTIIGERAVLMGGVGSAGHLRVGAGAFVGARAGLHKDVSAGARVFGVPAVPERRWHRMMAALGRLPDALRRLRRLEQRVEEWEEGGEDRSRDDRGR
jgi:UDP-3-O-[3-hydroxymyristoyl] glucosamine N-acyltransferase